MGEGRIDRHVSASIHQAIADVIEHLFRLDRFHCRVSMVGCRVMGAGACTFTIAVGARMTIDAPRQEPAEHGRLSQAGENVS